MRSDLVVDLPVTLDRTDDTALPQQLAQQIRALIGRGVLNPGDQLPSGRALAGELSVARGTVVTAYEELCAEGYLVARHGSGTMVNPNLAHLHPQGTTTPLRTPVRHSRLVELTPGAPDTSDLADPSWRAAWRQAAAHPGITNTDPLGLPELRWQICEHLRQMRSLVCDPGQVVVTSGAREGLALLLHVARGSRQTIGVESPGYPSLRKVPPALGHRTVNLPTDEHGLLTDELPEQGLDAVLVTPGHQYPDGGSLSTPRRVELAAWAARTHSWIIEDDFDSELRHVGQPLPALATLQPSHTVLLGTFSSVMTSALACGYLIVPPRLVPVIRDHRRATGQPVGALVQHALASYLETGALRRRTQRLRQVYRRRRQLVIDTLADVDGTELLPINGGLHAVLVIDPTSHASFCGAADPHATSSELEASLVRSCAAHGIGVRALSRYWGGEGAKHGIVLGFGRLSDEVLAAALEQVARIIRAEER